MNELSFEQKVVCKSSSNQNAVTIKFKLRPVMYK